MVNRGIALLCCLTLSHVLYAQNNLSDLSRIYAVNYLEFSIGLSSSHSKVIATDDPNALGEQDFYFAPSYHFAYGRNIHHNFFLEAGLGFNKYILAYYSNDPRMPSAARDGRSTSDRMLGVSLKGIYHYPVITNRLFVSGLAGFKLVRTRKYTTQDILGNYRSTNWNNSQYSLGANIGAGIQYRLSKRTMFFLSYSFCRLITNNAFINERGEYLGGIGQTLRYYEVKQRPYTHQFQIGIRISTENSLFYKKNNSR